VGLIDSAGVRRLQNVHLDIRAGEIVGIAALEGSASWLLRILAGRYPPTAGRCTVPPQTGFIAEDRRHDSLIPEFSLYENVALKDSGRRNRVMPWPEIKQQTASLIKRFDVRAHGIDMRAQNLSGGNQQKLVLGRELADSPVAVVAENPTRGLDISASEMIHDQLRQARDAGCAIVFYSSDIDELVDLANRVLVLREGTLTEVPRESRAIGSALLMS
jgi:simple sugar transport system ATP-binding protein